MFRVRTIGQHITNYKSNAAKYIPFRMSSTNKILMVFDIFPSWDCTHGQYIAMGHSYIVREYNTAIAYDGIVASVVNTTYKLRHL